MRTVRWQFCVRLLLAAISSAVIWGVPIESFGASNEIEIKSFGLLDFGADLSVRYMFDQQDRESSGFRNFEERVTWEQLLTFKTRSYVYHPGFLNIDFNFGPQLVQQRFEILDGSNTNSETLLNYYARLNFLQLKAYPFSIYSGHSNPSVRTGISGRYLTERNEHGLEGSIFDLASANVVYSVRHLDSVGSGFGRLLDEDLDTATIRITKSYRGGDLIELRQGWSDRNSESGSPGLPVQRTQTLRETSELIARNSFGRRKNYRVTQTIRRLDQELVRGNRSQFSDWRYVGNARLDLTDSFSSNINLKSGAMDRDSLKSRNRRIGVSATQSIGRNLSVSLTAGDDKIRQTGFESDIAGYGGNFLYTKNLGSNTLSVGGRVYMARTDQVSTADTVAIFDEVVVLVGTTPVDLAGEFVVPGSVTVSNESRTQIYVEGLDYRLVTIGSATRIQRLVPSNIEDGESVLVDYEVRTSGTALFDTLTSDVNLSANFLKYFNTVLAYGRHETDFERGELLVPINDREELRFSIGADVPLGMGWTAGARYRYTDRNEEISPSVSDSIQVNVSKNFSRFMSVDFSASYHKVDQEQSVENVDRVEYGLGINSRFFPRVPLRYHVSYMNDDGGSLPRRRTHQRLNFSWRYRDVVLHFRAEMFDEKLGESRRDGVRVSAEINRYF